MRGQQQEVRLCAEDTSLLGVRQCYRLIASSGGAPLQQAPRAQPGSACSSGEQLEARVAALLQLLSSVSFQQAVVFCKYTGGGLRLARRVGAGCEATKQRVCMRAIGLTLALLGGRLTGLLSLLQSCAWAATHVWGGTVPAREHRNKHVGCFALERSVSSHHPFPKMTASFFSYDPVRTRRCRGGGGAPAGRGLPSRLPVGPALAAAAHRGAERAARLQVRCLVPLEGRGGLLGAVALPAGQLAPRVFYALLGPPTHLWEAAKKQPRSTTPDSGSGGRGSLCRKLRAAHPCPSCSPHPAARLPMPPLAGCASR